MNETEWFSATDPTPMMEYARANVSERKRRLVVCATLHLVWDQLHPAAQEAGRGAERMADTPIPESERSALATGCLQFFMRSHGEPPPPTLPPHQLQATALAREAVLEPHLLINPNKRAWLDWAATLGLRSRMPDLFREVVGNPFRPVVVRPEWRTSDVMGVAEAVYAGRDYAALPVLADALQDAGCDDAALLGHLRGGGVHVRGCWALDAVLGRA